MRLVWLHCSLYHYFLCNVSSAIKFLAPQSKPICLESKRVSIPGPKQHNDWEISKDSWVFLFLLFSVQNGLSLRASINGACLALPLSCVTALLEQGGKDWFTLLFMFQHDLASRPKNNSVWRDLWRDHVHSSIQSRGSSEFHACCTVSCQLRFDYFHGWRFHSIIAHLISLLDHPHGHLIKISIFLSFIQLPLILSLFTSKKSVVLSLL